MIKATFDNPIVRFLIISVIALLAAYGILTASTPPLSYNEDRSARGPHFQWEDDGNGLKGDLGIKP